MKKQHEKKTSNSGTKKTGKLPEEKKSNTKSNIRSVRNDETNGGRKLSKALAPGSQRKTRVNDYKTGRVKWLTEKQLIIHSKAAEKYKSKKTKKEIDKISKFFDTPGNKIKGNLYDNADSYAKILSIISKQKRLRYKGKFITEEAQEAIVRFSKILDREKVDYTLSELLQVPEIARKIIITEDKTPKELFYWNILNKIERGEFGMPRIIVYDFDGKLFSDSKDLTIGAKSISKFSRRLSKWEKLIAKKENINECYITVPCYETKRDGEILQFKIDYQNFRARIKNDIFKKYRPLV